MFQVLKRDRKYSGQVNRSDKRIAPFTAFTNTPCVLAFHSWCFLTPSLGAFTFFFLILFYTMVCLFLYIFLRRTLQRHHERGRATPATTGAFSCCWNYVRHLKLSRTAKFQGESSFLGSTAATKEEGAGAETTADPCLVAGCAGLRLFPRTHEGSWLLQWKPCGWAGVFRGKSGFRYAKRRVLTSQATSSRYVCLCVNLLVIIWGTCRDHALTMKTVLFSRQRLQHTST